MINLQGPMSLLGFPKAFNNSRALWWCITALLEWNCCSIPKCFLICCCCCCCCCGTSGILHSTVLEVIEVFRINQFQLQMFENGDCLSTCLTWYTHGKEDGWKSLNSIIPSTHLWPNTLIYVGLFKFKVSNVRKGLFSLLVYMFCVSHKIPN